MNLHHSTFDYLKPTDNQVQQMARMRTSFAAFASVLLAELPDGPDKTFIMRGLRDLAMWSNVTITRLPDGTPREDYNPKPGPELAHGRQETLQP